MTERENTRYTQSYHHCGLLSCLECLKVQRGRKMPTNAGDTVAAQYMIRTAVSHCCGVEGVPF